MVAMSMNTALYDGVGVHSSPLLEHAVRLGAVRIL